MNVMTKAINKKVLFSATFLFFDNYIRKNIKIIITVNPENSFENFANNSMNLFNY